MSLIRDLRPLYLCLLMSHLTLQDVRISLKSQVPKSTGDTKFTMATEDTQFSIPTENTQFSMATEDTQFSIPTENTQFSMATKSAQFSMATEDTQFSIPKKEKQLYMVTEGTQFYIPITDTISHLKTEDTQFSIPTEDKYYNLTTEDTLSNLTTEDTLSNLITEDTLSNLTTEDTLSNLTIEDTLSNLTIEDTLSNLTTEDTLSNLTTEDTLSNLTTENTFWSLTTDEGSPFDETALDGIKHLSTSVTGDVCLFKGDDLNLICSLYEPLLQNYTARDITFRFVQQIEVNRTNGINRCVPGRVINETAAMLTVRDVTFDDVGHFSCYVGDNCHNEHYSGRIVGNSDSVLVEYPPQEVTNISCVVNDWNVSMTCTWEHPVEYFDWTDVSVTSSYYIDGTKSYEPCPAQISTTACVWDYPSFRAARYYTIRVEVTNKCSNITVSSEFEIYTYEFVKPSPVENLTAEKTEPGCLELSWKHAKPRYERICTLTQQVVGESNFSVVAENFTVILTNTTFNTCGYESYTHHNFSLECYPVDPYSGFWSDPAYTDVWTRMTAPDLGPRTTNGSFTSTPCVGGWRNVTVMWQEVNMSARNGKIDGYLITLNGTVLSNVTEPEHSATVSIHCKLTELAIFAHNEGNYSLNPSVLIISPDSFSVPKTAENTLTVEIIPNLNGKNFHLSWEVDEGTADMNFTVFWCEYQQGQTCTSEINWSEVPSPQTYYDVNISSSKDDRAYQFGISVTDIQSGMGSEIFWAKCQFTRNPTTMQNVQIRNLQVTSDHQSALVSWNKDQCFPQEYIKITNILIKWCATSICSETDHIPSANISSLDSSYLITSLNAKINYSVIVQPESYGQHGSEVTLWVNVIPLDAETSLSLEAILGGIAGGVVVVVLVVVGLLLYRNCLLRKKDINMFVGSKVLDFEKYNESGSPPPQLDTQPPSMTDYQDLNWDKYIPVGSMPPVPPRNTSEESASNEVEPSQSCSYAIQVPVFEDIANSSAERFDGNQSNNSRVPLIKEQEKSHPQSASPKAHVPDGVSPVEFFTNAAMDVDTSPQHFHLNLLKPNSSQDEQCQTDVKNGCARWSRVDKGSDIHLSSVNSEKGVSPEMDNNLAMAETVGWQQPDLGPPEAVGPESMRSYTRITAESSLTNAQEDSKDKIQDALAAFRINMPNSNIVCHALLSERQDRIAEMMIETEPENHSVESSVPFCLCTTVAPNDSSVLGQDPEVMNNAVNCGSDGSSQDRPMYSNFVIDSSSNKTASSSPSNSSSHTREGESSNGYVDQNNIH